MEKKIQSDDNKFTKLKRLKIPLNYISFIINNLSLLKHMENYEKVSRYTFHPFFHLPLYHLGNTEEQSTEKWKSKRFLHEIQIISNANLFHIKWISVTWRLFFQSIPLILSSILKRKYHKSTSTVQCCNLSLLFQKY